MLYTSSLLKYEVCVMKVKSKIDIGKQVKSKITLSMNCVQKNEMYCISIRNRLHPPGKEIILRLIYEFIVYIKKKNCA
jgi:hypothetical protein